LGGVGVRAWGVILTPAVFAKEAMPTQKGLTLPFVFLIDRGYFGFKVLFSKCIRKEEKDYVDLKNQHE
jgi:hypothetical protein